MCVCVCRGQGGTWLCAAALAVLCFHLVSAAAQMLLLKLLPSPITLLLLLLLPSYPLGPPPSDPDQEWRGPLFRVPITVIKPQDLLHTPDVDPPPTAAPAAAAAESPPSGSPAAALSDFGTIVPGGASGFSGGVEAGFSGVDVPPHTLRLGPLGLGPGQEVRRFVVVPAGATWAEIVVRTGGSFSTPKMFMLR